jgi:hypothetical protein
LAIAGTVALVLAAVAVLFVATPHGIGITPDSTQYLAAARHILQNGFQVSWGADAPVITHFPPGFAVALSVVTWLGVSVEVAARLLNAIGLVATGLLTFSLARRASRGSTRAGIIAAAVVVFGRDILAAHSMVWSEPLFIPLTLGALLATARVIDADSRPALVAAILLAGAAGLTRYAAPSVIVAATLSLLMLGRQPVRRRVVRAFTFAAAASLPIATLLAVNSLRAASATNRELAFHPMDFEQARSAASTAYYWVMPIRAPGWLEIVLFCAIGISVLLVVVSSFRSGTIPEQRLFDESAPDRAVLACFAVGYVLFLYVTITLFDAQATPDARLLLPVVPPLSILAVAILSDAMRASSTRVAATALAACLLVSLACSTTFWVRSTRLNGLGYNAPAWRLSPLMAAIRELPPETLVVTNHPSAHHVHGRHDAREVPRMASPTSLRPNDSYARQMEAVCAQAGDAKVAYAHFTTEQLEWFMPSLAEVRRRWHSLPRLVTPDGVLDTVPASCASIVAKTDRSE